MYRALTAIPLALLLVLQACAQPPALTAPVAEEPAASPLRGPVTDRAAFDRFIAATPTPEQFRARYPDVALVLPGMITTKELRTDNSRFFADVDAQGRITGGRFR